MRTHLIGVAEGFRIEQSATGFDLQVVVDEEPAPNLRNISYSAAEDPVIGSGAIDAAFAATPPEEMPMDAPYAEGSRPMPVEDDVVQQPVRVEKTPGRNEPCFCGSGKKYKLCHGR